MTTDEAREAAWREYELGEMWDGLRKNARSAFDASWDCGQRLLMSEHGPDALWITPEDSGRFLIRCLCGMVAACRPGQRWVITPVGKGKVSTVPSIDLPGHFHTPNPSGPIRLVESIIELHS